MFLIDNYEFFEEVYVWPTTKKIWKFWIIIIYHIYIAYRNVQLKHSWSPLDVTTIFERVCPPSNILIRVKKKNFAQSCGEGWGV